MKPNYWRRYWCLLNIPILAILIWLESILLIGVFAVVFAMGFLLFSSRNPLTAWYRFNAVFFYLIALSVLVEAICFFVLPEHSSFRPEHKTMTTSSLLLVIASLNFLQSARLLKRKSILK